LIEPTHRAAELSSGGECGMEINKMIPGAAKAETNALVEFSVSDFIPPPYLKYG